MTASNPYAPPENFSAAPGYADNDIDAWQENGRVVVPRGGQLPGRCVRCNAPATTTLTQTIAWHHPALYVLIIFPGILIYALIALVVRKKATLAIGLCENHRQLRLLGLWVGWGGFLLALVLFYLALDGAGALAWVGLVLLVAAIVAGIGLVPQVQPTRIDDSRAYLKAGRSFVESLPHSPQRAP